MSATVVRGPQPENAPESETSIAVVESPLTDYTAGPGITEQSAPLVQQPQPQNTAGSGRAEQTVATENIVGPDKGELSAIMGQYPKPDKRVVPKLGRAKSLPQELMGSHFKPTRAASFEQSSTELSKATPEATGIHPQGAKTGAISSVAAYHKPSSESTKPTIEAQPATVVQQSEQGYTNVPRKPSQPAADGQQPGPRHTGVPSTAAPDGQQPGPRHTGVPSTAAPDGQQPGPRHTGVPSTAAPDGQQPGPRHTGVPSTPVQPAPVVQQTGPEYTGLLNKLAQPAPVILQPKTGYTGIQITPAPPAPVGQQQEPRHTGLPSTPAQPRYTAASPAPVVQQTGPGHTGGPNKPAQPATVVQQTGPGHTGGPNKPAQLAPGGQQLEPRGKVPRTPAQSKLQSELQSEGTTMQQPFKSSSREGLEYLTRPTPSGHPSLTQHSTLNYEDNKSSQRTSYSGKHIGYSALEFENIIDLTSDEQNSQEQDDTSELTDSNDAKKSESTYSGEWPPASNNSTHSVGSQFEVNKYYLISKI